MDNEWDFYALRDDLRILKGVVTTSMADDSGKRALEMAGHAMPKWMHVDLDTGPASASLASSSTMPALATAAGQEQPKRSEWVNSVLVWQRCTQDSAHDDYFVVTSVEEVDGIHAARALTLEKPYHDCITGEKLDRDQVEAGRRKELAQMQEFGVADWG
eukprot:4143075-Amphidinium_carterae.6